jgi:hypothetical protein
MDLTDPFDEDEMREIIHATAAAQVDHAIADAQEEIGDAVIAIETLTARLLEMIPAPAVVNLVASMAVGAAISGTYGDPG